MADMKLYFPQSRKTYSIKGSTTAGRDEETCDLCLVRYFNKGDVDYISNQHFVIDKRGQNFVIKDLDSRNGTELNGGRLLPHEPRVLRNGSQIKLAKDDYFIIEVRMTNPPYDKKTKERADDPFTEDTDNEGPIKSGLYFEQKSNSFFVDGKQIPPGHLTVLQEKLLKYLLDNAGRVCSRDELGRKVWGWRFYDNDNDHDNDKQHRGVIDKGVSNLRKKLDDISKGSGKRYIDTVHGRGYTCKPKG